MFHAGLPRLQQAVIALAERNFHIEPLPPVSERASVNRPFISRTNCAVPQDRDPFQARFPGRAAPDEGPEQPRTFFRLDPGAAVCNGNQDGGRIALTGGILRFVAGCANFDRDPALSSVFDSIVQQCRDHPAQCPTT